MVLLCGVAVMVACKKEGTGIPLPQPGPPKMTYLELGDTTIGFRKSVVLDIDKNGESDIWFSTLLVGDALFQVDKWLWLVNSSFYTYLPVKDESIPAMENGEAIPHFSFSGHNWYNASSLILAQKIIPLNGSPYWLGNWKDETHRFLPIQVMRNGRRYNGWIEASFDTLTEKVTLHRAAICDEANKTVFAGK